MNTDDFEQKLQQQPLRRVPTEWRWGTLSTARQARGQAAQREGSALFLVNWWRSVFGQAPVAWGALAAVWLALIAINFSLFGTAGTSPVRRVVASVAEPFSIWNLQSAELQQLASGDQSVSGAAPANLPAATPRSPRSERRHEDGVGEIILDHSSNFVV